VLRSASCGFTSPYFAGASGQCGCWFGWMNAATREVPFRRPPSARKDGSTWPLAP
jgi:hypothetical protein